METIALNRAWSAPSLVLALTAMPLGAETYSPHVDQTYPDDVYWGDTHLHTALSVDGYIFGNRLMPDDAYRFAKGEKVRAPGGEEVRLRRPLDFLMVSDHAENMGVIARIDAGDSALGETEAGKLTIKSLDYPVSLSDALRADTPDPLNAFNAAALRAIKANQGLGAGLGGADFGIDRAFSAHRLGSGRRQRGAAQRSGNVHDFCRLRVDGQQATGMSSSGTDPN